MAWASDVEAIFIRFRLFSSDTNYLCSPWQEISTKYLVCQMDRVPFNATCSSFIAIHNTYRSVVYAQVGEEAVNTAKKESIVRDCTVDAS